MMSSFEQGMSIRSGLIVSFHPGNEARHQHAVVIASSVQPEVLSIRLQFQGLKITCILYCT